MSTVFVYNCTVSAGFEVAFTCCWHILRQYFGVKQCSDKLKAATITHRCLTLIIKYCWIKRKLTSFSYLKLSVYSSTMAEQYPFTCPQCTCGSCVCQGECVDFTQQWAWRLKYISGIVTAFSGSVFKMIFLGSWLRQRTRTDTFLWAFLLSHRLTWI